MRRVDEVVRQRLIHIIAEIKLIGRHYRVIVAHEISKREKEMKLVRIIHIKRVIF